MLNYPNQQPRVAFNAVALTSAFTNNRDDFEVAGFSKVSFDIDYIRGGGEASSALKMQLEHSTDRINWFSLVIDDTTTESTITPRVWSVPNTSKVNVLVDIAYIFLRVSLRETGVVTNAGTATVTYMPSGF